MLHGSGETLCVRLLPPILERLLAQCVDGDGVVEHRARRASGAKCCATFCVRLVLAHLFVLMTHELDGYILASCEVLCVGLLFAKKSDADWASSPSVAAASCVIIECVSGVIEPGFQLRRSAL